MARRSSTAILSSLLLLASTYACDGASGADPVIIAFGDQTARRSEFERHLQDLARAGQAPVSPAARQGLLEAWLERRALAMEARARGVLGAQSRPEEEQEAITLLLREAAAGVEVTAAELEQEFVARPDRCAVPEMVALRQVLVPTLNQARDVVRRLRKDPKTFAAVAQTLSRGPEASAGGFMGRFARGQLPSELEPAAFAVPSGQTSDIIQTPLGYHVLRVEERTPARQQSLEECRTRLQADLLAQKSERRVREFVAGVMARAKVNHEAAQSRPSP